jgi:hypothetical protein
MVAESSNLVTLLLEGIMGFLLLGLLYYAMRILTSFKRGMLERGWRLLSVGIIILVAGELVLTVSNYNPVGGYLFQLGIGIDSIGVLLAVLGFKSHFEIWNTGKAQSKHVNTEIEATRPES